MSTSRFFGFMRLALMIAVLALSSATAQAATALQYFFPINNDPFNTIDDEIEVRAIYWDDASQPVKWVLIKPSLSTILLPVLNLNGITDVMVLEATQRSLREWNDNDLSDFDFEDDVFFSSGPGSGAVPNPKPVDAFFDGHNAITFQSSTIPFDSGTIALASVFFLEDNIDLEEFEGVPLDLIESGVVFPFDLNLDGFIDFYLPAREYSRAEIVEADIAFNPALTYFDWPVDIDDIDPLDFLLLPNSLDIQTILTHELGHAMGLGHTFLEDPTMTPVYGSLDFPVNPYTKRSLSYDDELAASLTYPGDPSGGTISGWLIDGQSADIYKLLIDSAAPLPLDLETINPALQDLLFVVSEPVFVGHPAPPGLHPDNVLSEEGTMRMIGQVLTGQNLRYPAGSGGAVGLEPAVDVAVNIDFADVGEDLNQNGIIDLGEDVNVNGILDPTTLDIDSKFRFPGLFPREDYVVYIDEAFDGLSIAISPANAFLSTFESFIAEFYGGTGVFNDFIDDNTGDEELVPEFISIAEGGSHDIVIITNTESTTDPEVPDDGESAGQMTFVDDTDAFTTTTYVGQSGDLGDINGDGFLDLVIAVLSGGEDVGGGTFNRLLINVPQNVAVPNGPRRFQDITFGVDGVAGTADDILPAHIDNSVDAKFGDFNNDGHLDIFISNVADSNSFSGMGGYPRLYIWEEFPANPFGFRYLDVSESTLPGLLNRGYDPMTPAAGLFFDGRSDASRAAVGDIDGDGDLDIIVSMLTPSPDDVLTPGMVDTNPNEDDFPEGDFLLTLVGGSGNSDPDLVTSATRLNEGFSTVVYTSGGLEINGGPLVFSEQVLINKTIDAVAPGFYFVDETLGADNTFGDSTRTIAGGQGPAPGDFSDYVFNANTDRMPPVFPPLFNLDDEFQTDVRQNSPQGYTAFEPRLGPVYQTDSIDLISARAFTDVQFVTEINFAEQAIFKNLDINEDGLPDGYYANINYGLDFLNGRRASGLFPTRTTLGGTSTTLEAQPLLIGIPDGLEGDVEGDNSPERNIFSAVNRGGFTAGIGDWEYRGAGKPFFASDTDFGAPFFYKPREPGGDTGATRAQDGLVGGLGNMFISQLGLPISFSRHNDGSSINSSFDAPRPSGETHGLAIADFNNNGSPDTVFANSVVIGFRTNGIPIVINTPAYNNIHINNGFGTFTNVTDQAFPGLEEFNAPTISYQAIPGDVDNDGDKDIVFINALSKHELFVNQIYDESKPIRLDSSGDATLLQDQTPLFIPPAFFATLVPPFIPPGFATGITTSVTAGDFNADGLPDIATADGGIFSTGDFPQIQFNNGPKRQEAFRPFNDAVQHLSPAGGAVPGPRRVPSSAYFFLGINGFLFDEIGAYYGAIAGDFSGDGHDDLFFSRNGEGPIAFLNIDGSFAAAITGVAEADINSAPDLDVDPDGIFINLSGPQITDPLPVGLGFPPLVPPLTDPCPDLVGSVIRKNLGRRSAAADFNNDGTLDVFICNGIENSGAANTLLFNFPVVLFPFPIPAPRFFDVTETNLPTIVGDCAALEGVPDDSYHAAAGDFDHDGDVDIIIANRSDTSLGIGTVGFRYLENDGTGIFTDTNLLDGNLPEFLNTNPRYILIGDFDGAGEPSEDVNGNGFLDPGEDTNGNSVIDFTDLPDETVAGDVNGDGVITARTDGVWEPSFDLYITFQDRSEALLINDPTNASPGIFSDESALRLPPFPFDGTYQLQSNGARAGDMDNDGDLDIVVSKKTLSSFSRPVRLYLNDGTGVFTDASHEVPFPQSVRGFNETKQATPVDNESQISFTGNANDLELVDIDLDGDLDVYVGMAGRFDSFALLGSLNVFYVNRFIGANYNATQPALDILMPPGPVVQPPVIFAADPNGGYQGTSGLTVDVIGSRFEFSPNTTFNFGAGITVNNVTYLDPNLMQVNVDIDPAAALGPRAVAVQNPSTGLGTTSATGIFSILEDEDNSTGAWIEYD